MVSAKFTNRSFIVSQPLKQDAYRRHSQVSRHRPKNLTNKGMVHVHVRATRLARPIDRRRTKKVDTESTSSPDYETETYRNQNWPRASSHCVLLPKARSPELALEWDCARVCSRQMNRKCRPQQQLHGICKEISRSSTNCRNMHLLTNRNLF